MNIIRCLDDPEVFGPYFRGSTWQAWRAFLAALFAQPLTPEQLVIYSKHTSRSTPPASPLNEAWLCIGRRGGKSFILAVIAVFLACFRDWRPFLGPGEAATIMIIARDRRQARVIKRFITGLLHEVPMLRPVVEAETQEAVQLRNRVSIEIHTASFRSTRGYTIVAALLDEIAYWETDETSAEPDIEVINAIKPGMATIPGAMLLCASSPHARRGALWDAHRKHFGQDNDPVLVWQAATRDMNPSVPQNYIDKHVADDAARAAAEYGAQFRTDVETFVSREVIDAAVVTGRYELPPMNGVSYAAFTDPSGGSLDSFTLAIAHRDTDGRRAILDMVRERRPPFSPDGVVQEFAELLKAYGVRKVTGDRYAGEWPRERFRVYGIEYVLAEKPKSDLYRDLLPLLNSGRVELLDLLRLATQLTGLERRTARGGKDSIDHAPGSHDDVANCVAGSLLLALAGAPALWRQEAFLMVGAPAPMPARCDMVFAVLMAAQRGDAAVVYFASRRIGGSPLLILDCEVAQLVPALFNGIVARLTDLAKATRARGGAILFTSRVLAEEVRRLGYHAEVIDGLAAEDDGLLALAAAVHIGAGRVKITAEALAKAEHHPLGGILDATAHDDDPLRTAALVGIAIALDENRGLRARSA